MMAAIVSLLRMALVYIIVCIRGLPSSHECVCACVVIVLCLVTTNMVRARVWFVACARSLVCVMVLFGSG